MQLHFGGMLLALDQHRASPFRSPHSGGIAFSLQATQ